MKLNAKKKGVDSIGTTATSTKQKAKETFKNDLLFPRSESLAKNYELKQFTEVSFDMFSAYTYKCNSIRERIQSFRYPSGKISLPLN